MKGLSRAEMRGVVTLLILMALLVGIRYLYDHIQATRDGQEVITQLNELYPRDSVTLVEFDPNTVDLASLRALGLTKSQAVSVIRYREAGKIYRIKEDLYTCYGIDDSTYYCLEPYIVIGEEFRFKKFDKSSRTYNHSTYAHKSERKLLVPSPFRMDTVGVEYLYAIGALSRRQGEVLVRWREMRGGIFNIEELKECYTVSDSVAIALEEFIIFPEAESQEPQDRLVDINRADTTALCEVYGIGSKSAKTIVEYREKLGGFYCVEQLSEVKEVTESNFEKILQQILCDSCDISKIDVNFASAKILNEHPYISKAMLRRLLKVRQLKGGWSTIEEMKLDNILDEEEAIRLRPYLLFRVQTSE